MNIKENNTSTNNITLESSRSYHIHLQYYQ